MLVFCALLFVSGMCGLTLELAVRLSGYANQWIYDPIYAPFPEADDLPYIHKPGLESAYARDRVRIHTDSLGNRSLVSGREYGPRNAGQLRIAVFGDSLTFGHGLPETADTYCCQLESLLARNLDRAPQVFNFGTSAYSVREMTASLRERALHLKPDLAFMAIIADDLDLSRTPDLDRWGFHHNRRKSGWLDKNSRFKRLLRRAHSVYFIRDHLPRPRFGKTPPPPVEPPEESFEHIDSFMRIAKTNGIQARVVLLPSDHTKNGILMVRGRLQAKGIPVIDLIDIADHLTTEERMVNKYNAHPSAKVHRLIAESLAEFVLNPPSPAAQDSSSQQGPDSDSQSR